MKQCIVFLIPLYLLFSGVLQDEGLPGIELEVDDSVSRFVTGPRAASMCCMQNTEYFDNSRAEVLWVDRAHQNAIAEHVSIAGYGMCIQSGWYLNNERTSLYRTLGTNIPQWTFPMPNAAGYIPVDLSPDANAIIVASPGEPVYTFSYQSPTPKWTSPLPGGFSVAAAAQGPSVAVSDDGTLYAVLGRTSTEAKLFIFNADGDTIRTMAFVPNTGVYGLDASSDLSVLCVSTYWATYIYNLDGTRRDSLYNYGQTVAKISADGTYLVKGDFSALVRFYRWNGANYEIVWQHNIGHPWVTALAISDDGSTIMAGTYQYTPANSGKVVLYDSSAATPLWEYTQYGDYVASCALSEDGSRGVAGSWGQYNATFGDVATVFERTSSTPLLQILDDIDEPGSIFSVAISNDGSFVTAGGKAVHARQMGNGGEVYAIRMLDSLSQDVGVEEITSPPVFLQLSGSYAPQAVVTNYGTQTVSFDAACMIYDSLAQLLYCDTVLVNNLSPGAPYTVDFSPSWSVPAYGRYSIVVTTLLAGDEFPLNDTLVQQSICYHDGGVSGITYPFAELTLHYEGSPRVAVTNHGSYAENIPVKCDIYDALNTLVYTGTAETYLAPLQTATLILTPIWTPTDTGLHHVICHTQLAEDIHPSNDTLQSTTQITTEILYDDGIVNVYGIVSGNYYDNKFAECMIPCLTPPYYIPYSRFFVNSADSIVVSLNGDSAGLPGLGSSFQIAPPETVVTIGAGWVIHNYAPPIQRDVPDPFWMVIHWLPSSPDGPAIGMDNTAPRDSLSYWYWTESSDPGWHHYPFYDFMLRVYTTTQPGICTDRVEQPLQFTVFAPAPNPSARPTVIRYTTPSAGKVTIKIYDVTGRLVTTLIDGHAEAGSHNEVWRMTDDRERRVTSGVYFLKATFGEQERTAKIIVLMH